MSRYWKTFRSYFLFLSLLTRTRRSYTSGENIKWLNQYTVHPIFIFINFPNFYNICHSLFTLSLWRLKHIPTWNSSFRSILTNGALIIRSSLVHNSALLLYAWLIKSILRTRNEQKKALVFGEKRNSKFAKALPYSISEESQTDSTSRHLRMKIQVFQGLLLFTICVWVSRVDSLLKTLAFVHFCVQQYKFWVWYLSHE